MATAIKNIPVLKDKAAKKFVEKAEVAFSKRKSVNFSKQVNSANLILEKAGMK